jgi:hypothetical protein
MPVYVKYIVLYLYNFIVSQSYRYQCIHTHKNYYVNFLCKFLPLSGTLETYTVKPWLQHFVKNLVIINPSMFKLH